MIRPDFEMQEDVSIIPLSDNDIMAQVRLISNDFAPFCLLGRIAYVFGP